MIQPIEELKKIDFKPVIDYIKQFVGCDVEFYFTPRKRNDDSVETQLWVNQTTAVKSLTDSPLVKSANVYVENLNFPKDWNVMAFQIGIEVTWRDNSHCIMNPFNSLSYFFYSFDTNEWIQMAGNNTLHIKEREII